MTAKIRAYELAQELGLSNAEVLDLCNALGIGAKSHSSSIVDAQADRVRRKAEREGLIRNLQAMSPEQAVASRLRITEAQLDSILRYLEIPKHAELRSGEGAKLVARFVDVNRAALDKGLVIKPDAKNVTPTKEPKIHSSKKPPGSPPPSFVGKGIEKPKDSTSSTAKKPETTSTSNPKTQSTKKPAKKIPPPPSQPTKKPRPTTKSNPPTKSKNYELSSPPPIVVDGMNLAYICLLYTSPSPRDRQKSRMPSSA